MSPATPPSVIVTRPAAQAAGVVRQLAARGIEAVSLPLIEIAAAPDPAAVAAAWAGLALRRLVVFVSANAVEHFFALRPPPAAWPAGTLAAAPGPGTADALRRHGLDESAITLPSPDSPQFDSESLWQRLAGHDWHGASVLVVRGESGREWLAGQLSAAGATVEGVAAYARVAPRLSAEARRLVEAAAAEPARWVWLFSSSEAIDNLEAATGIGRWRHSQAVATHPRIAARARAAGFADVREAPPGLDAVAACIQSLRP